MVSFDKVPSRSFLWGHVLWFGAWLFVTVVGAILTPSTRGHGTHQQLGLPPCPSVLIFNRPCPGCGLTTSFTATIHGDFAKAFSAHVFGPIFYVLFTLSALACLYGLIVQKRFNTDSKSFNWALGSLIVVYLAYSGFRFITMDHYKPFMERPVFSRENR
jgi:hypothetical protein